MRGSNQHKSADQDAHKDVRGAKDQEAAEKVLLPSKINPRLKAAQYAVRGELYLRAEELRKEGKDIIFTNIGNPQALGSTPITFIRQVVALCAAPFLMDNPAVGQLFPEDAIQRAKHMLDGFKGKMGAYTDSRGNPQIRGQVADFIARRDGVPRPNPENIYLSDGASSGVRLLFSAILRGPQDAMLVPVPQYPLYSASCALFGGTMLSYYLDESSGWSLDIPALKQQLAQARRDGLCPRAIVLINPGNPTGQTLEGAQVEELVRMCHEERLVLVADEVYQELVYTDRPFVSAYGTLCRLGEPYRSSVELFSLHTVSKGTTGECGLRGGYMQATNIHPDTMKELYKLASINLCPNTVGQVVVSCMVEPPPADGPSRRQYDAERARELASLRRRARLISDSFAALPGVECNPVEGALYAFPCIKLPRGALEAAEEEGKKPDVFYCLKLLEATGISTVPGSGFGQADGTFHLRTTILPQEDVMHGFCDAFKSFHTEFMEKYGGTEEDHDAVQHHHHQQQQQQHQNGHT